MSETTKEASVKDWQDKDFPPPVTSHSTEIKKEIALNYLRECRSLLEIEQFYVFAKYYIDCNLLVEQLKDRISTYRPADTISSSSLIKEMRELLR
jgi:hypothetical protein